MRDKIIEIVLSVAKEKGASWTNNMDADKPWDSFMLVEIIFALEDEFDISFDEEDIKEATTFNKLIEITENKAE